MSLLNVITEGLLDNSTPLSILLEGEFTIPLAVDDVVVVVEPPSSGGGGGGGYEPYVGKYTLLDRKTEPSRDIHKDDDEVLEILMQTLLSGVIR